MHTALRDLSDTEVFVDQQNVKPLIKSALAKIKDFSQEVLEGNWKGYSGKQIDTIVNIGIGGSDLGPDMIVEALQYYQQKHIKTHFVSNIDGDHVHHVLHQLDPETTLFVIVSKTFTTQETLTNAQTIRKWFLETSKNEDAIAKHFVAVSTNLKAAQEFGIAPDNIFPMWDWVGGRFSLWSAVGLSISLSVGFENFESLLKGANQIDKHFKETPFEKNIPVLLALISVWYNNFYNAESEAILPYAQSLLKLPDYLQQAIMESNGKGVDRNGQKIDYQTGTIIWGSTGTNSQHAFMQLLHQGTKLIPADFIGFKKSNYGNEDHHQKLMFNFKAQIEGLAFGKTIEEVSKDKNIPTNLIPFKVFEGNRPSTSFLFDQLNPYHLGQLIAIYEHKIFVQGIIWNIFSYDQFGVELGKENVKKMMNV